MADIIHDTARNGQMGNPNGTTTTVDFDLDDTRLALIDDTDLSAPTGPPLVTWDDWADLKQGTVVAGQPGSALSTPTVGSAGVGAFDAVDYTFSAVSGDAADYLNLRKFNATDANSTLVVTWDSAGVGLPITPNGNDIDVVFAAGGIVAI
jgi:hypothetical protein